MGPLRRNLIIFTSGVATIGTGTGLGYGVAQRQAESIRVLGDRQMLCAQQLGTRTVANTCQEIISTLPRHLQHADIANVAQNESLAEQLSDRAQENFTSADNRVRSGAYNGVQLGRTFWILGLMLGYMASITKGPPRRT